MIGDGVGEEGDGDGGLEVVIATRDEGWKSKLGGDKRMI